MDSGLVVQHMLSQKLINDHTIISSTSDYHRNCLIVESIRLMDTQSLMCFCKILQMFDCQKHIANMLLNGKVLNFYLLHIISYSYVIFYTALQSFDSQPVNTANQRLFASGDQVGLIDWQKNIAFLPPMMSAANSESMTDRSGKSTNSYFKPSLVHAKFLDSKMHLENMLKASDSQKIYQHCKSMMASNEHNIALFSKEFLDSLKECSLASQIVQRLSGFITWSDHSLLSVVVNASDNAEATEILQLFDAQVDLSLPITEYPVPQPIPSMAPYNTSTHTVMAVKLNTRLSKFSLQQVLELRCSIQKNFQITEHCLLLMAAKSSLNILYWMIPKCISHLISSKIMQDINLHESRIEEISVYPGTLFVSTGALKLGSLSFLTQINQLVSYVIPLNRIITNMYH